MWCSVGGGAWVGDAVNDNAQIHPWSFDVFLAVLTEETSSGLEATMAAVRRALCNSAFLSVGHACTVVRQHTPVKWTECYLHRMNYHCGKRMGGWSDDLN